MTRRSGRKLRRTSAARLAHVSARAHKHVQYQDRARGFYVDIGSSRRALARAIKAYWRAHDSDRFARGHLHDLNMM